MSGRERLSGLREECSRVEAEMIAQRRRFADLRRDASAPRAVAAFNLFQTPEPVAARMVAALPEVPEGAAILEPSAGLGRLYAAIRQRWPRHPVELVEQSSDCAGELYRMTEGDGAVSLMVRDFLAVEASPRFSAVVMNPPFKQGRDIRHIMHARRMLQPGGSLVALCYDGVRQCENLRPVADSWHPLPPGSFKAEGTNASAVMLTMRA